MLTISKRRDRTETGVDLFRFPMRKGLWFGMRSYLAKLRIVRFAFAVLLALATDAIRGSGEEWTLDANKEQRIDAIFGSWNTANSPGAAVGVVRRGELVFSRGYGSANLDHAVPIRPDSVFYIASTSKQFTAAGIAILSLDGVVDLDDDIRRWVPELPSITPQITIRHLIHHTSGIRDYGLLMLMQGRTFNEYFDNDDTVALLARQKAGNFTAGKQFRYCNSNYVLLAEILERASGMTSQEFAEKRIFTPLGMDRTRWGLDPRRVLAGRVTSYLRLDGADDLLRFDVNFSGHGDGNLWTTVEDLARWDGNFYEPKVGGRDFLRLISTRGRLRDGLDLDYAFGLSHGHYMGHAIVSHAGQLFGYCSEVMRFPEQGLCVIVLANLGSIDVSAKAKQITDIVLELPNDPKSDEPSEEPVSRTPADVLASYVGEYYQVECGRVLKVAMDAGRLTLHGMDQPIHLYELRTNQFEMPENGAVVTFETCEGAPARAVSLKLSTAVEPVRLERLERTQVDAKSLADFAGRYRSDELQTEWALHVSDAKLAVRWARRHIHLNPLDRDRFGSDLFDVSFRRDKKNRIVGFTVLSDGASGIVFDRVTP